MPYVDRRVDALALDRAYAITVALETLQPPTEVDRNLPQQLRYLIVERTT